MNHAELVNHVNALYEVALPLAGPGWYGPTRAELETYDRVRLERLARVIERDINRNL